MNPNAGYRTSVSELLRSVTRNRSLIFQMTKREVAGRYRGSVLGIAWSFFKPLIMLEGSPYKPHANLIEFVTDRLVHDSRYAIDAEKIRKSLGWASQETFESSIVKTIKW